MTHIILWQIEIKGYIPPGKLLKLLFFKLIFVMILMYFIRGGII